tara:strand:- start:2196 stop:2789 length:594 start_codon:yes stop_codon:yes gene_type:complete
MGLWDFFFGKKHSAKPKKSRYLPEIEDPIDIRFVKNFKSNGGYFLYNDSKELVFSNLDEICLENSWALAEIVCFDKEISELFSVSYLKETFAKLNKFKALLIKCEYLISNSGKILLSDRQIKHLKLIDLPETILISAKISQFSKDVSEAMSNLKNKYKKNFPTNITTLKAISKNEKNEQITSQTTDSKNIYLLLEDF